MTPARAWAADRDDTAGAIARSVIYASLFDYPLTLAQLRESLLQVTRTEADILATYEASPRLQDTVSHAKGYFFPAGRDDLVDQRRARERRSLEFLQEHRAVLNAICALPYVRMVALSGSIAHLNLTDGGDLDIFIVTSGRHVWSVTVAAVLLAKLLRRRRTVCVNYVIADSKLQVDHRDLFTANQILHLKPIYGEDVFAAFVTANPFVAAYYPNFRPGTAALPPLGLRRFDRVKHAVERALAPAASLAEWICRTGYRAYLQGRSAAWKSPESVRLEAESLKLHARSHRDLVMTRYDAAIADLLGDRLAQGMKQDPALAHH